MIVIITIINIKFRRIIMIKSALTASIGLGAIAISYFYGQSFIAALASAIVTLGGWLHATYVAAMSVVALSAFPYIVIGLVAAFACYHIMLQAYKLYFAVINYSSRKIHDHYSQTPTTPGYKIALASILLGLVAAIVCKLFFAAAVLSAVSYMPVLLAIATNVICMAAMFVIAFIILRSSISVPKLPAAIIVVMAAALCAIMVLGSANVMPALLAATTSFVIVNAIAAGVNTVLTATLLPTVLAYLTVGTVSAGITKGLCDLFSWFFPAPTAQVVGDASVNAAADLPPLPHVLPGSQGQTNNITGYAYAMPITGLSDSLPLPPKAPPKHN